MLCCRASVTAWEDLCGSSLLISSGYPYKNSSLCLENKPDSQEFWEFVPELIHLGLKKKASAYCPTKAPGKSDLGPPEHKK